MKSEKNGSALIVTVFAVALLAMLTSGILEITTEDIQIMRNHIYAAEALATADAGLNDAFAQLRSDSGWTSGFTNKAFGSSTYTVTVTGTAPNLTVTSTGVTSQVFTARVDADVTTALVAPYVVRIDQVRINE